MKIETLVCPNCGCRELGKAKISGNIGTCPACDETFVLELAEKLSAVEVDKTKDLQIFRTKLSNAVAINDVVGILNYSKKIIEIIPEDYTSVYFHAYAQNAFGNNNYLSLFYHEDVAEHTPDEIKRIVDHIIAYSDLRDEHNIISYLSKINDIDSRAEIERYKSVFALRCQQEEAYDNIPRDVFICHRSTDADIAQRICHAIEEDGSQCWISNRNLRPNDYENYWSNIEKAIKSCKIFLVVSSREAMLSKDVKREIEIATELDKARLECKIDTSAHTLFFKHFFDGITWIDLCNINEKSLADLRYRVFIALNPQMISKSYNPNDFNIKDNVLVEYQGKDEIVYIPETVDTIGEAAFFGCKNLKEVICHQGIIEIGESAFEDCISLVSVSLSKTQKISKQAFCGCTSLCNIEIPASVETLQQEAFKDCTKLKSIKLGSDTYLERSVFENTEYANDKSNWENGLLYINNILLEAESGLDGHCVIKEGTTQIVPWAFEDTYYDSIVFPSSLILIGENAINDCPNLQTITIPSRVRYIGASAVSSCTRIEVEESNAYYASKDGVLFSKDGKTLICYPKNSNLYNYEIPEGVEVIGVDAFEGCGLVEVFCPNSLSEIGDGAFSSCGSLEKVVLSQLSSDDEEPTPKVSIGKSAFWMSGVEVFNLDQISYVGRYAFDWCKKITLYSTRSEQECAELRKQWSAEWNVKDHISGAKHQIQWNYSPRWELISLGQNDSYAELRFGKDDYCAGKCEFYRVCPRTSTQCVKQCFREAIQTLTPREERIVRLNFGIECNRKSCNQIEEEINAYEEEVGYVCQKALRKLEHPSRLKYLDAPSIGIVLFAIDDTSYSKLYRKLFKIRSSLSRDAVHQLFINREQERQHREKEIADFENHKKEVQANISHLMTLTDCCFGDRFNGGIFQSNIKVGEIKYMLGKDLFKLCDYNKKLFEEIIKVLHSNGFRLGDHLPDDPIQKYLERVYWICKEAYTSKVLDITVEELDLSVRSYNCLKRANINTVSDLVNKTEYDMINQVRNLGLKSLNEIKEKLAMLGLSLKADTEQ